MKYDDKERLIVTIQDNIADLQEIYDSMNRILEKMNKKLLKYLQDCIAFGEGTIEINKSDFDE